LGLAKLPLSVFYQWGSKYAKIWLKAEDNKKHYQKTFNLWLIKWPNYLSSVNHGLFSGKSILARILSPVIPMPQAFKKR
jgi:hypothetical protein